MVFSVFINLNNKDIININITRLKRGTMKTQVDEFRLNLGSKEYIPLVIGGMGVEISTTELAVEAARLGGIGHISDALITDVADRKFATKFVSKKRRLYHSNLNNADKSNIHFDLEDIYNATYRHVEQTMSAKTGDGLIFINCMEKLTMNNAKDTLSSRLNAALDAGIDGISLSAGLHLNSFALIANNPRFRSAKLGIIVSSLRALRLFLQRSTRFNRIPDFVIIEGPLAGGHLGFSIDSWQDFNLTDIFKEIQDFCIEQGLNIPLITAGGIFTGTDAVNYLNMGASAVQVATRFTVTNECGLPNKVKQEYFMATKEDVEVNLTSPTGYPMRMLKHSPSIGGKMKPNCESLGYLLEKGKCAYIDAYEEAKAQNLIEGTPFEVVGKTCLCTQMQLFQCYTCGQYVYRLKDTTNQLPDGSYQILSAEHVFKDYQYSSGNRIAKPELINV